MAFLPGQPDDAYAVAYGGGNLYSINRATGTMTVVGYMGSTSLHDLAVDPMTSIIYGTDLTSLYTIDPTVPSVTLVGSHGAASTMIAIGCDGSGDLYGYDITTDLWYSIDKSTGAATQIGAIGFNSSYAQGMFYDQPTGNLMMAAYNAGNSQTEIRAVDVTTGASVILSNGTGMEITGVLTPSPAVAAVRCLMDSSVTTCIATVCSLHSSAVPIQPGTTTSTSIRIITNML